MSFKQMMQDDLEVFYNSDEFAESATFHDKEISVLFLNDIEISQSSQKLIKTKSSDTLSVATGDSMSVNQTEYEVLNFDFVDESKLEMIISLKQV